MERIKTKAQFFTIDALIALTIIIITVVTVSIVSKETHIDSSVATNILDSLSSLKIGEMDNTYAKQLIEQGYVTDTNKPVIDQIGEFYITNITIAKKLSEEILSTIDPIENIGIWYGTNLLASKNITPFETAKNVFTERQVISGIGGGDGITGFSARAFLSSNTKTDYVYFGGYIGEGNISTLINYQGNISTAKIELVINNDFEVYINGVNSGNFSKSANDFSPVSYNLNTNDFVSGNNIVELKGNNLHITGGFIKITYDSDIIYEQPKKYYFPGISGIINLYDGFYVPGNLTGLTISLHFNNSVNTFLTIGNTRVFNDSSSGTVVTITNSTLASLLNYSELSKKTIPLRFGMDDMDYISNNSKDVDVFSVTSISGQMQGGSKIDLLKAGNYQFVSMMLNNTNHRVGLAAYEHTAKDEDFHSLSDNVTSLNNTISGWIPGGSTCTCCGINKAVADLVSNSDSSKFNSIVIMSAGAANTKCLEQGTGDAEQDAIKAACDAYTNHNIRIYTIGFGDTPNTETLTTMASCGDGSYYNSVDNLTFIYEKIAEELIETAYYEQTIEVTGDFFSQLYPDSYIEFKYTEEIQPTGIITTIEKPFSTSDGGTFEIPTNFTPLKANVISYSGPRWTSEVNLNEESIYNLSSYETEFLKLGDPYSINLPASSIQNNNTLELKTGLSPSNTSAGSINNKIIYTISKASTSYTSVSATAEGCNWNIHFNDYNLTLPIPTNYLGSENCNYGNSSTGGVYCGIYSDCDGATDAIQIAVYNVLKLLDFNSDGKIDIDLSEDDLIISTSNLEGIPFLFSTEVQIRKWH